MMKISLSSLLLLSIVGIVGCASGPQLTGTAYTVTYRPADAEAGSISSLAQALPAVTRRAQTRNRNPVAVAGAGLVIVDVRNGTALASSSFDAAQKAYFFRLPLAVVSPDVRTLCLSMKNAQGATIPLRNERAGDDGYEFRNPLWEGELRRVARVRALKSQLSGLDDGDVLARAEIEAIERKYGAQVANGAQPCAAPVTPAPPARPEAAMDEASARAIAPALCALKWEAMMGALAETLFRDAGRTAEWEGRGRARAPAAAMSSVSIVLGAGDRDLVKAAAEGGPRVLQHQKGMQLFDGAQGGCVEQVVRVAAESTAAWTERVRNLASAPARAKERCEGDVRQVPALKEKLANAAQQRRQLEGELKELERKEASATESADLLREACVQ